ncbi:MAG: hypothetical protein IPG48_09470 [Saprospiraceae bacterium]|nr:hypothetical protein [Saprospiraceae bacterium]MBK7698583.1 hypothetical protein [Saprospiraceae bacterium]HQV97534.1 hypothetical protein [Saprospiraceae bacterium]
MRKILFIVYLIILSCGNKNEVQVYELNEVIFAINKNRMFQFHKGFHQKKIFIEASKSKYCGSSLNLHCMDDNRNSYQLCLEIIQSSKSKFQLISADTCASKYFDLKGNKLTLLRNKDMKISWDSIVITYEDFPNKRTIIPNLDDGKSEPNLIHPFTLSQEVYFIVKKDFTLINSVSTNENTIVVSIFNKGNLIKKTRGNLFPNLLHHINSLIE